MEHTGLPHDHGEEQNHTAAMQELLRDGAHFQNIADIFRQLGDPNRIRIFWLLCHCEAVSYTHLAVYKRQGWGR